MSGALLQHLPQALQWKDTVSQLAVTINCQG
jgi:hypothetical protein